MLEITESEDNMNQTEKAISTANLHAATVQSTPIVSENTKQTFPPSE